MNISKTHKECKRLKVKIKQKLTKYDYLSNENNILKKHICCKGFTSISRVFLISPYDGPHRSLIVSFSIYCGLRRLLIARWRPTWRLAFVVRESFLSFVVQSLQIGP